LAPRKKLSSNSWIVGSDMVDMSVSVKDDHRLESELNDQRKNPFRFGAGVDDGTIKGLVAVNQVAICVQGPHHHKLITNHPGLGIYHKSNSGLSQAAASSGQEARGTPFFREKKI
jgi:hypothetical protein